MKFLRVGDPGHEIEVASTDGVLGLDVRSVITEGADPMTIEGMDLIKAALAEDAADIDLTTVRIGSPIARPGKVVCVGLNYRQHAAEAQMPIPEEPILFMKTPYTVQGPNDTVIIPPSSEKTDYEVELAIVIGRRAEYLSSPAEAREHILGYAISDDVSERHFQLERGGQWDKGKNCDTFNPLGPWIATTDEIPDPQALDLRLRVNNEVRQNSSTADMIFDVDHLVWYVSQFMTLLPGDVINTGTPQGVGSGFTPGKFLSAGDVVEVEITGLGVQRHEFAEFVRGGTR
ncbi:fumarylacetoacetate hydrolase family protein [Microbacterium sp. AK031]|uniref:fumarylacetoacetate hydrolase family protein n=1 Tax=Microbacterium sp. AK031 TaxID=2723076 RepID=UPI00216A5D36|nr:fumarylacetoacetate hydrolase family protein [Microbacterium sp. AK031]MCS3844073.1 2-keto-4-pentenoate hydratase/2-oxohepta-3-ene-1,7-dioic acid hydratase in catechol pathway [Microbacterium sp. AK031]